MQQWLGIYIAFSNSEMDGVADPVFYWVSSGVCSIYRNRSYWEMLHWKGWQTMTLIEEVMVGTMGGGIDCTQQSHFLYESH